MLILSVSQCLSLGSWSSCLFIFRSMHTRLFCFVNPLAPYIKIHENDKKAAAAATAAVERTIESGHKEREPDIAFILYFDFNGYMHNGWCTIACTPHIFVLPLSLARSLALCVSLWFCFWVSARDIHHKPIRTLNNRNEWVKMCGRLSRLYTTSMEMQILKYIRKGDTPHSRSLLLFLFSLVFGSFSLSHTTRSFIRLQRPRSSSVSSVHVYTKSDGNYKENLACSLVTASLRMQSHILNSYLVANIYKHIYT